MESSIIRNEVRSHAPSLKAIWPNGLGYCWRGWEYSYSERGWSCQRINPGSLGGLEDPIVGWGIDPPAAKHDCLHPHKEMDHAHQTDNRD